MIIFKNKNLLIQSYNILLKYYPTIEIKYYSIIGFKNIEDEKKAIKILNKLKYGN